MILQTHVANFIKFFFLCDKRMSHYLALTHASPSITKLERPATLGRSKMYGLSFKILMPVKRVWLILPDISVLK